MFPPLVLPGLLAGITHEKKLGQDYTLSGEEDLSANAYFVRCFRIARDRGTDLQSILTS
jgi:hypothetical protein